MNDRFNGQIGGRVYEDNFGWRFAGLDENHPPSQIRDRPNFFCIDRTFNFRPYFVYEKKIAIVGNSIVEGCGDSIDSADEVIRINDMRNWKCDSYNDGIRTTVWAGLPVFAIGRIDADMTSWLESKFFKVASNVNLLWSVSPFQCTVETWKNLVGLGLHHKLKTLPGYYEYLDLVYFAISPEMRKILYGNNFMNGYTGVPNFELLFTGVKICLACFLDGAKQIDLFGFDFFAAETYWKHHDLHINLQVLLLIEAEMSATGRSFNWNTKENVINRLAASQEQIP